MLRSPHLSVFYQGGEGDGAGWDLANRTDDTSSQDSLKSKILRSAAGGMKQFGAQPEAPQSPMAVQAPPTPAPFTPQMSALDPMGSQMTPRARPNPRLQQAMLEA